MTVSFRQRDLTRAIKAAEAAGCVVKSVEVLPDGTISLKLDDDGDKQAKGWGE